MNTNTDNPWIEDEDNRLSHRRRSRMRALLIGSASVTSVGIIGHIITQRSALAIGASALYINAIMVFVAGLGAGAFAIAFNYYRNPVMNTRRLKKVGSIYVGVLGSTAALVASGSLRPPLAVAFLLFQCILAILVTITGLVTDHYGSRLATVLSVPERAALLVAKPLKWLVRGYMPYGYYLVDSTTRYLLYIAVSVPLLAGVLLLASLTVCGPDALFASLSASEGTIGEWGALIAGDLHYLAIGVATYYLVSAVVPYRPHDKHQKDYRRRHVVEGPYEWERLVGVVIPAGAVAVTFGVVYFLPRVTAIVLGGTLGVALGALILAMGALCAARRKFVSVWEDMGKSSLKADTVRWEASLPMCIIAPVLLLVTTGIPAAVVGVSQFDALFVFTFIVMAYTARTIRWTQYEDRDGMVNIRPHIRFWGTVSRVPLVYSAVVVLGGGISVATSFQLPVFCMFAPLAAGFGYLTFRVWRTNRNMYLVHRRVGEHRDDYDVMEDLRRNSPMFNHEQAQALHLKNRRKAALIRAQGALQTVNKRAAERGYSPVNSRVLTMLTYDVDTSYARRQERIARSKSALRRLSEKVSADEGDTDLRGAIEQAESALATADELNERVGKSLTGWLNERLFD